MVIPPSATSRDDAIDRRDIHAEAAPAIMGGGPTEKLKNEVLLCVFEAPEPKESTARIREKFPELEVRYLQTKGKEEVPKGQ